MNGASLSPMRAAARPLARTCGVLRANNGGGSLLEVCNAGNSNRVLGLFTDLPKGVK